MPNIQWLEHLPDDGVYSLREAQNSLLQVLLTEFDLSKDGRGFILNVNFTEADTAIRRREAKRRVQEKMPGYPGRAVEIQDNIDAVLFRGRSHYAHSDPDFVFRYASGGTLPIIEFDSAQYYCLFYRDVFPVGWNIANGACDSLPELLDPKRAIERELREELMIFALHTDPPVDYRFAWVGEMAVASSEFEIARWLASAFLAGQQNINQFRKEPLEVRWDPSGPDTLRVRFGGQETVVQQGFYLNINASDFGIEFDRIARVRLPEGAVLLDGELNDNRLLNQPIGLFEVGRTQKAVYDGSTEFVPERLYYDATPEFCSPPSAAALRGDVLRNKYLERLLRIGVRGEEGVKEWEAVPPGACLDLCPVTRSIIRRHMRAASPLVFISYSHADREFAAELERGLKRRGVRVWRDAEGVSPSERVDVTVKRAIENSSHVILLGSPDSVNSRYVLNEVLYADSIGTPGIVVMKERLESRQMPLPVMGWPRVDFKGRYAEALGELEHMLFKVQ